MTLKGDAKLCVMTLKGDAKLCVMTLKGDAKFKGKLTRGLKNDVGNLVNFHPSS